MDGVLTTKEYAELHGVSRRTVQRWAAQSLIFSIRIGKRVLIPIDEPPPSALQDPETTTTPQEVPVDKPLFDQSPQATSIETPDLRPEVIAEEIDDLFDESVETILASLLDGKDLRRIFATLEEALDYGLEIPVTTRVFRRAEDGFFQVEVLY